MDDIQIQPADNNSGVSKSDGTTTGQSDSTEPKTQVNQHSYDLAADVDQNGQGAMQPETFIIPKLVKEKYSDLIDLIKNTESMDDEEKQYWFQILPIMTVEQIDKLKVILNSEKEQLQSLDREYEEELQKLNDKHLIEWKEFESKEKSQAIQKAETKSSEEEKKTEEELLAKLNDI